MDVRLDGQVALVTGASRGIGREIARVFAENGARVMLSSRNAESLEAAAESIEGETAVFAAHAGRPDEAVACVTATLERFGRLDILVNNAATNPYMGPSIDVDGPRYDKTFEVNLRGALFWTQAAWNGSMRERGGSVVNLASIGGMTFGGDLGVYDVTKAGLIHLTKHLATELGPRARVNAIAPGLVQTDMARRLWEEDGDRLAGQWPLRRLGVPLDVANAALFLVSDLASWITGDVLVVDGGASLVSASLQ